jgi:hypothetical protein
MTETLPYKFDEDKYLKELEEYINSTYVGHYSQNKFQTTEIIIERGRGTVWEAWINTLIGMVVKETVKILEKT